MPYGLLILVLFSGASGLFGFTDMAGTYAVIAKVLFYNLVVLAGLALTSTTKRQSPARFDTHHDNPPKGRPILHTRP